MLDNPTVMDEPDIFLSYHRTPGDTAVVERVRARLASLGLHAFLDSTHLVAGFAFYEALEQALRRCRAVAVFVGAELGDWQRKERSFALERQLQEHKLGRAFPVVPVLLPGAKVETAFLFQNTWVDLRNAAHQDAELDKLVAALRHAQAQSGERRALLDVCPYRGLNDFGEEDAALFHGREALIDQLALRVQTRELVVVVGSSGTGKSSLVKAGLVPRLRRSFPPALIWEVVVFTPGREPFSRLASGIQRWLHPLEDATARSMKADAYGAALREGATSLDTLLDEVLPATGQQRLLLVIDQFEELFTLCQDSERRAFVQLLLKAMASHRVTPLLTLRAEYFGRLLDSDASGELKRLVEAGQVNVIAPVQAELRAAIVKPAELCGLSFESPLLVERMLAEVDDAPGRLPLLEFALQELWNHREGTALTERGYQRVGNIKQAIATRADREYQKLSPSDREHLRRVMVRLVRTAHTGEGINNTRERLDLASLEPAARAVVERFAAPQVRLLVTAHVEDRGIDTVEVAHEALIDAWGNLKTWLSADLNLRLWRQRIAPSLSEWQKDPSNVLVGAVLAEARAFLAKQASELLPIEVAFIKASARRQRRGAWLSITAVCAIVVLSSAVAWQTLSIAARLEVPLLGRVYARYYVQEPDMVEIRAGEFLMGSAAEDQAADDGERPAHKVYVGGFALGRTEVTFEQYDRFAQATGRKLPDDNGWGRGTRPVINVSWEDAQAYAAWLSKETGAQYRLPSEAEWEYAARGGSQSAYGWGDDIRRGTEVMANCAGCGSKWDDKQTAPVGSFAATAFGVKDLHGNVWEWTADCWHANYQGAPKDGRVWTESEGGDCRLRVVRGGSWDNQPQGLRSADRRRGGSGEAFNDLGFRLARTLP